MRSEAKCLERTDWPGMHEGYSPHRAGRGLASPSGTHMAHNWHPRISNAQKTGHARRRVGATNRVSNSGSKMLGTVSRWAWTQMTSQCPGRDGHRWDLGSLRQWLLSDDCPIVFGPLLLMLTSLLLVFPSEPYSAGLGFDSKRACTCVRARACAYPASKHQVRERRQEQYQIKKLSARAIHGWGGMVPFLDQTQVGANGG